MKNITKALLAGAAALLNPAEAAKALLTPAAKALTDGVYVSRPVLNAKKWHDWGVKHGIPNLLPADQMHVTIIYSTVEVLMALQEEPVSIHTRHNYAAGCFARFGKADEVLVFAFHNWELEDRNYAFLRNGAVSTWPTFRPHMTISADAGDFELPKEALQDCPDAIILGAEVADKLKPPAEIGIDDTDPEGVDDGATIIMVVIEAAAKEAAKALLDEQSKLATATMDPMDFTALHGISEGLPISKGVAKRLAAEPWATEAIKALGAEAAPVIVERNGKKFVERELTMTVAPLSAEITKALGRTVDVFKHNDEKRLALGWASVSKVNGEFVTDLQGDTITCEAQEEWLHSLLKGQRAGKMNHEGEDIAEVVGGLVFDAETQKALGIDLGLEGCLVQTHYTCAKTWDMVKKGKWMYSIAGTVLIEVAEEGEA